jgi:CubicO group peptidase (beta-lactamase class C family)
VKFPAARHLIATAVAEGAAPAAAIEVGQAGRVLWRESFGRLWYDAAAPLASERTIFDLASLTKVIATTSLAMSQIAAGRLSLATRVGDVLDGWRARHRAEITIRHLLDHSSGLPGQARLWEHARGRAGFERAIRELPLERAPGTQSVYSDPGFMLLGFAIETAAGQPLDAAFEALATGWQAELMFRPPPALINRIAPTELDVRLQRAIRGEVHDENAAALGGVAGHAGLFGAVVDVGTFARLVLRTFHTATPLGTPDQMRVFARQSEVPASSRALGWDTMRPTSSCGSRFSPTAIGHTGFTGTSLWIDWERDVYVVLLTNRVHPTRTNDALVALRPQLHDAVMEVLLGLGI